MYSRDISLPVVLADLTAAVFTVIASIVISKGKQQLHIVPGAPLTWKVRSSGSGKQSLHWRKDRSNSGDYFDMIDIKPLKFIPLDLAMLLLGIYSKLKIRVHIQILSTRNI